jgi:Na+:H+ antiporter, NhaA family
MTPLSTPLQPSRIAPLVRPIQAFLSAETAGGIMLVLSAAIALAWANSPWGDAYQHFWHTPVAIGFGEHALTMSLEHWVNDGLMVIFFLLVGLEIKREVVVGELASPRKAAMPIAAAIGGMVVPAGIYVALNYGNPAQHGWGIPMATDIAFAAGVMTMFGRSLPLSAKVFLLAIAIVDDLGAVVVIAAFYTSQIHSTPLITAGGFLLALIALNVLRVHRPLPYALLGVGLWIATLYSGVHATVAGVLLAFTIPATRPLEEAPYVQYMRRVLDRFAAEADISPDRITEEQSHAIDCMTMASRGVQTPLSRIEHALLGPVTLLIIPIFALANAGVDLRSAGLATVSDPVTWGVLLGLLVGKPVGVLLASWIAVKTGLAAMPEGTSIRQVVGIAILCGIGFTMSLFVANLAFPGDTSHLAATKIGILSASLVAGVVGGGWRSARRQPAQA